MLCQECQKNPACVHITHIEGSRQNILHLCENCAAKSKNIILTEKISDLFDSKISIHDFFNSITNKPRKTLKCPKCNMSYSDFTKTGRIGCSVCYNTFFQELEPLIKRVHTTPNHIGKTPKETHKSISAVELLENLKIKLNQLIKEEKYEKAAKIRDEIKSLQSKTENDKSKDIGEDGLYDK